MSEDRKPAPDSDNGTPIDNHPTSERGEIPPGAKKKDPPKKP